METTRRYFLRKTGETEIEVTEAEFVAAERAAGFGYPSDSTPVTNGFGNESIRGRIRKEINAADAALTEHIAELDRDGKL